MCKTVALFLLVVLSTQLNEVDSNKFRSRRFKSKEKAEEAGGNFQGDMILNKVQFRNLESSPRNGMLSKKFHWPKENDKVIVNFVFDEEKPIGMKIGKLLD